MNTVANVTGACEGILVRVDRDGVATLTLNRPQQLNALSESMLDGLQKELDAIAGDAEVRCVVIAGAGKSFCAGHDLAEMRANARESYYKALFDRCGRMMQSIQALPVPVIARVHGIATAAGCQLVGACDLAIAADTARFAVSGINLGLVLLDTLGRAVTQRIGQTGLRHARDRPVHRCKDRRRLGTHQ